jgi:Holliday junction resolvase
VTKQQVYEGEAGEAQVRLELSRLGFLMVERIYTPFKVVRNARGKVVSAYPVEKVSGDFIAVEPETGRKVLVEVKSRNRDRLRWSDLKQHQIDALDENRRVGGRSLLAFVNNNYDILIWDWPIDGFGPGKSIGQGIIPANP